MTKWDESESRTRTVVTEEEKVSGVHYAVGHNTTTFSLQDSELVVVYEFYYARLILWYALTPTFACIYTDLCFQVFS